MLSIKPASSDVELIEFSLIDECYSTIPQVDPNPLVDYLKEIIFSPNLSLETIYHTIENFIPEDIEQRKIFIQEFYKSLLDIRFIQSLFHPYMRMKI